MVLLDQQEHKARLGHLDRLGQMVYKVSKEMKDHLVLMESEVTQDPPAHQDRLVQLAVMESREVMAEMATEENKAKLAHKDQE